MGHHHHGKKEQADKWTNIATVGEAVASLISDTYWLATVFDVTAGLTEDILGLSYYAVAFGAITALLSAGGAAYCHRILNVEHQHVSKDVEVVNETTAINNSVTPLNEEPNSSTTSLTWMQKLALVGDFISHTGDIAGPCSFVVGLATVGVDVPRWGRGLVHGVSTFFGAGASVANVRTCRNAILEHNAHH